MVTSMNRWKGKVAIVTGASAGIGAAIAEQLVEVGIVVVGLARRQERLEELEKKLANKLGKLYTFEADMTKEEDILKAFYWTEENIGSVSILINNAGIFRPTKLTEDDTKVWKAIYDTNVLGLCIATREAIKQMLSNNINGHIIHINSIKGHKMPYTPVEGAAAYVSSKFAVTALTETLRKELNYLKSNIKSISPGFVKTEIVEANNIVLDRERIKFLKTLPILDASDIADATSYVLATPPHVQIHELIVKPVGETI